MRLGFGLIDRSAARASLVPKAATPIVARATPYIAPEPALRRNGPSALSRLVPFEPKGEAVPLFFLHIARTSGASLVCFLRRLYGAEAVLEGVDQTAGTILAGQMPPRRADCLAGAVPLMRWQMYRGTDAYRRITVLRDPWARLVSHINRLAVLAADPQAEVPAPVRALAAEVAAADFTSRPGLERLRRRLQPMEGGFDNLQTRMLMTGTMSALVKPLTPRDVDRAVANLSEFALVGFCEDQVGLQRGILRLTGQSAAPMGLFEAGGKPVVLSPRNELAREMLEPLYLHDQALYQRARAMMAARAL